MINYLKALYYLNKLMKRAYWNHHTLSDHQNKSVRKIVRYAYYNVPFYHRKLKQLRIKPDDIRGVADLHKLPVLRKDEMRKNLDEMVSREFSLAKLKKISTSGSTGMPLTLYISRAEDEFRKAKHLRANISCGQKIRDRWVVITSPHHFGEATRLQQMLGIYVPISISVFSEFYSQISALEKIKPNVLDGYSSSLLLLAKEAEKRGLTTIRPRLVIGGAELIDEISLRSIEEVFDAPFYDQYACIELERIAWQCPEKVGYHIDADSVVVQFVDKKGEEVSFGETGEVVCTSLFNFAMPLIRYAVGDLGVPSSDCCPCGRSLPLMKVIEGRTDSLLPLSDGRVLSPRTFTVAMSMFKFYDHVDQFRIVQKKIDSFEIHVNMKANDVSRYDIEKALIRHFRKMLGLDADSATLRVKFVDNIPLDRTGKLMMVVSQVSS